MRPSLWDVSVRIDPENPFLTIRDCFITDCEGKQLFAYLGSDSRVLVRKEVEVIENGCFTGCRFIDEVVFESGSHLKRICQSAFEDTGVIKFVIPRSVEVIEGGCFNFCMQGCSVLLEQGSCLRELGDSAFLGKPLSEFEIPAKCEELTGKSLMNVKTIRVHRENPFFVVENNFVMSHDGKRLVRYFGSETRVVIKKEVEVIGESCFEECKTVLEVCFEPESRLRCIDARAFYETNLIEIAIPGSVELIGKFCFSGGNYLCDVRFEGRFPVFGNKAFCACPVERCVSLWSKEPRPEDEQG
jgi:hypothetical protein